MLKKFKHLIKKEIIVYLAMVFILTLVMHNDLLSSPLIRLELMYEKGNYSHPFLYTLIVYSIFLVIRVILNFVLGLFEKKTD